MSDVRVSGPDGVKAWAAVEQAKAFCYALAFIGLLTVAAILLLTERRIKADIELAKIAAGCKE